jgi:hypothetical protein
MLPDKRSQKYGPWIAMGFCAALSAITVAANLWLSFKNGTDVGGGVIAVFLCNLPMCFYFTGVATAQLQREIADLKLQIAQLQRDAVHIPNA